MGLDMYVYRIYRPHLDLNRVYNYKELNKEGLFVFVEGEIRDTARLLLKYADAVKAKIEYIDKAKILKERGYKGTEASYFDDFIGEPTLTVFWPEREDELVLSKEEVKAATFIEEKTVYVVEYDEFCYWRKNQKLRDYIYELIGDEVENCGYYELSRDDMISVLEMDALCSCTNDWIPKEYLERIDEKIEEVKDCSQDESADFGYYYYEWY